MEQNWKKTGFISVKGLIVTKSILEMLVLINDFMFCLRYRSQLKVFIVGSLRAHLRETSFS